MEQKTGRNIFDIPGVIPALAIVLSTSVTAVFSIYSVPLPLKDAFMLYAIFMCALSVYRLELKVLK